MVTWFPLSWMREAITPIRSRTIILCPHATSPRFTRPGPAPVTAESPHARRMAVHPYLERPLPHNPRSTQRTLQALVIGAFGVLTTSCGTSGPTTPTGAWRPAAPLLASGTDKPNFNLEVILRPPTGGDGFGHVKFRQDNDAAERIDLGTWVRDLAPNTHYLLQRATDASVDDNCTGANWLTLGKGAVAQDVVTDDRGTANEDLFRILTSPVGAEFDIQFRVINKTTSAVVLRSACYQFFVR